MAVIQLRFDANKFKKNLKERLNMKAVAVTTNDEMYAELLLLFHSFIMAGAPVDTGAFAFNDSGYPHNSNKRYRQGHMTISRGHGLELDAVETHLTTGNKKHYTAQVLARMYGMLPEDVDGRAIYEAMPEGLRDAFLKEAGEIIKKYYKEA